MVPSSSFAGCRQAMATVVLAGRSEAVSQVTRTQALTDFNTETLVFVGSRVCSGRTKQQQLRILPQILLEITEDQQSPSSVLTCCTFSCRLRQGPGTAGLPAEVVSLMIYIEPFHSSSTPGCNLKIHSCILSPDTDCSSSWQMFPV